MSLRIAVAGKGGTGKTTCSALLCRGLLRRQVKPILAVDADPNSCLPEKLGVAVRGTIGQLRETLRKDPNQVPAGIPKNDWIERLINEEIIESTGFDMLVMGRQEGPDCYCYINNLLRQSMARLGKQYTAIVIDNEAGLEHLSRRTNGSVEHLLVVCTPTILGARTGLRILEIVRSLELKVGACQVVINPCDAPLAPAVAAEFEKTGLPIVGTVPSDPRVGEFELAARPLTELPDESPAVRAVDRILDQLLKRG